MSATVKLSGFKELEAELGKLGDTAAQRRSAMRVLKKVAKPLADSAQSKAPRNRGHLANNVTVSTKVSGPNAAKQAFGRVMREGGGRAAAVAALRDVQRQTASTVQLFVGPGRHPQAIFQEFGTLNHAPQPFMRPAWDENSGKMLEQVKAELWADIRKVIARAEKKAAKLAARG